MASRRRWCANRFDTVSGQQSPVGQIRFLRRCPLHGMLLASRSSTRPAFGFHALFASIRLSPPPTLVDFSPRGLRLGDFFVHVEACMVDKDRPQPTSPCASGVILGGMRKTRRIQLDLIPPPRAAGRRPALVRRSSSPGRRRLLLLDYRAWLAATASVAELAARTPRSPGG